MMLNKTLAEGHVVEDIMNSTNSTPATHHQLVEGGILSGRDIFAFNSAAPLPTFIIQLLIIICMSRVIKLILSPIKQPAVIAEIISGIILGPTALGHLPYYTDMIFPKASLPFLNLMSNFGLVLFLFLVGLELDPRMLKQSMQKSLAISLAGMALPFGVGAAVSYLLYTVIEDAPHAHSFTKYFLFLGVAMAITAFPVLARILTELDLLKTKVGGITISAAAVDDATSWCLLALVISLINAGSGLTALYVFLIGLAYTVFLVAIFRPLYIIALRRCGAFTNDEPSQFAVFLTLAIVFISAFITDAIGIHAIFGGFLAGIIVPHEGGFAYHVTSKLEDIVQVLFLPLYFALSGLRTQIGSLNDLTSWGMVLLVIFVACFGKIVGCTLSARLTRMNWRESFTVGALMNCKGLVELIVLNLGYDAHVINQKTFAIMVIMALVTTFITVPLVSFLYPPEYRETIDEHQITSKIKNSSSYPSLLVSVNKIEQVPAILSVIHLLDVSTPRKPSKDHSIGVSSSSHNLKELVMQHVTKKPKRNLIVNSLRLIELTERDSSVVLKASEGVLRDDPVMKMFHTFCEMESHDVRSLAKVVTMSAFADTLVTTAREVSAKYILIPWSGSGSLIEDTVSPVQQLFVENKRRQSIHTPVQHANFLHDLLLKSPCSVLVLVDRGLEISRTNIRSTSIDELVPSYQQIYLPFFGGASDREALEIVAKISRVTDLKVCVVRFKEIKNRRYSAESDVSGISNDTIVSPETLILDSEDEARLTKYFGPEHHRVGFGTCAYSEIESFTPISTAIQYMSRMGDKDLVIVGRESKNTFPDFKTNVRGTDNERKKVLGDIAESILLSSCASSLLVVQGGKTS